MKAVARIINDGKLVGVKVDDGRAFRIEGINEYNRLMFNRKLSNISVGYNQYGTLFIRGKRGFSAESLKTIDITKNCYKRKGVTGMYTAEEILNLVDSGNKKLYVVKDGNIVSEAGAVDLSNSEVSMYATFFNEEKIVLNSGKELYATRTTKRTLWKQGVTTCEDIYIGNSNRTQLEKIDDIKFNGTIEGITRKEVEELFDSEVIGKLYRELSGLTVAKNTLYRGNGWQNLNKEDIEELIARGINIYTGYFNDFETKSKSNQNIFSLIYYNKEKVPTGKELLAFVKGEDVKLSDRVIQSVNILKSCKSKQEAEDVANKYNRMKKHLKRKLCMTCWKTDFSTMEPVEVKRVNAIYEVKDANGEPVYIQRRTV